MSSAAEDLIGAAIGDALTDLHEVVRQSATPAAFVELEGDVAQTSGRPLTYPPAIRELYEFVFPDLDCQIIRLMGSPAGDPLRRLRQLAVESYDPEQILGAGLLPLAEDGNDGGPLVMDLSRGAAPAEAPIRLWDHERRAAGPALYPNATVLLVAAAHLLRDGSVAELAELGAPAAADAYGWWDTG
jgi:hypothetical protein